MITFLFWNLNQKPLQSVIARLALRHAIDVLMLLESSIPTAALLKELNGFDEVLYHYAPSIGCKKIEIFTKFTDRFIRPVLESPRLTVRRLALPGRTDVLLAVNHFPSKLYWSEASQTSECIELSQIIRRIEREIGHSRTVLVGDFNMNPFEDGLVTANGLHVVMSRGVAEKGKRTVQAREYPFFYNPMWSLFGDASPGPAGTYYYNIAEHKVFFWNMFDQVLIRPDLLEMFKNEDLEIIQTDGEISFLSNQGSPDVDAASDHLPVLFKLWI